MNTGPTKTYAQSLRDIADDYEAANQYVFAEHLRTNADAIEALANALTEMLDALAPTPFTGPLADKAKAALETVRSQEDAVE